MISKVWRLVATLTITVGIIFIPELAAFADTGAATPVPSSFTTYDDASPTRHADTITLGNATATLSGTTLTYTIPYSTSTSATWLVSIIFKCNGSTSGTWGSSSPAGSGSIVKTTTAPSGCTSATQATWALQAMDSTGAFVPGSASTWTALALSPLGVCTGYSVAGSYVGTTLAIRAQLPSGTTFPTGGLRVDVPDLASNATTADYPSTPTLAITSGASVDGQPNTYYATTTLSTAPTTKTFRVSPVDGTGKPTCYASGVLSSNAINQTAPAVTGNDGNSDGTSNCGVSWNLLTDFKCGFRWAFYCDSTCFSGWQSRVNTVKSNPPLNIFISGVTFMNDTIGAVSCNIQGNCDPNAIGNPTDPTIPAFDSPDPNDTTHKLDLVQAVGDMMQTGYGRTLYLIEEIGLYLFFIWFIWDRLSRSFGGK